MKSWIDKFFKREVPFNYVLADYQPMSSQAKLIDMDLQLMELELETQVKNDEMEIDNLYQRN